jgi:hypothetical protein
MRDVNLNSISTISVLKTLKVAKPNPMGHNMLCTSRMKSRLACWGVLKEGKRIPNDIHDLSDFSTMKNRSKT